MVSYVNATRKARKIRCKVAIECGPTEVVDEQGCGEQGARGGPKPGGHEGRTDEVRTWGRPPRPRFRVCPLQSGLNATSVILARAAPVTATLLVRRGASDLSPPCIYESTCSLQCDLLKGKAWPIPLWSSEAA